MNYFITGLPRSRTSWLANLLTYGRSFCLHDAVGPGTAALEVVNRLTALALETGCDCVGDSDSGLPFLADELNRLLPSARWVFVHRDAAAAEASFINYFAGRAYRGGSVIRAEAVPMAFDRAQSALAEALRLIPASRRLDVPYEGLENRVWVRAIWEWCVPNEPFNGARWEQLHTMQVNPIPEKIRSQRTEDGRRRTSSFASYGGQGHEGVLAG